MALEPLDFAFDYITRSGRVDMDWLRKMAPAFAARFEGRPPRISDPVPDTVPGAVEIGFDKTRHTNCSDI
jgi:hypothetical protein